VPNIVGIWNSELTADQVRGAVDAQLGRVRTTLVPYETYRVDEAGFGAALLDHKILANGVQPVHSEDGDATLFLDGEILNARELRHRFRAHLPDRDLSPPELCLALLRKEGEEVARLFAGHFAIVLYRRRPRSLTLITDRFGVRPVFFVERGRTLVFASEIKGIVVADPGARQIDEVATLERFCYGCHVFGDTWIAGYRKLRPATILVADEAGVRSRTYWRFSYDESAPHLDQQSYWTRYAVLLDRAVERAMGGRGRIGIFLSGGYDSRSIAAAIRRHNLPIPSFTFGLPESRDRQYAKMLADRLGLDHHGVSDPFPYLLPNCRNIVWRTDGLLSFASLTSINHHPFLKEHADVLLFGFLAEYNGSHTWPKLLLARSREAAMDALFARYVERGASAAGRVLKSAFFERNFAALRERFRKSFEDLPEEHPLNVSDAWLIRNFEPLGAYQAASIDRHLFEHRMPLMDFEVVEFLLTIPPRARLEQRVYKRMIAYGFPRIRDIPCTNSARPINPHFFREYVAMVLRYAGRKLAAPLVRGKLGRAPRDVGQQFRAEPELMDQVLKPLLAQGIFPEEIFDRAAIEQVADEHYRGVARHESLLSALISWGLGAKYLLRDDFGDVDPRYRGDA